MKKLFILSLLSTLIVGCTHRPAEQFSAQPVTPLYSILRQYADFGPGERAFILETDSALLADFMQVVSSEPFSDGLLEWWSGSMPVRVFTPDVDSIFPSLEPLQNQLGYILGTASERSLDLPTLRYAAVVYGRTESILFKDSCMFIALNHYLGSDYPGYSHWPAYMRNQKTPQRLPYDIAEALVATRHPYLAEGPQATVLSRLLYEGAVTAAKLALVPDASPELALGYDAEEMKWLADHESDLWLQLVAGRMLYDTSEALADRLVAPSPQVRDFTPAAPGRAGRYIGYRIVDAYLRTHPNVELYDILNPQFYTSSTILAESGYKTK